MRSLLHSGALLGASLAIAETAGPGDWRLVMATAIGSFAAFLAHARVSEARQRRLAREEAAAAVREAFEKFCPRMTRWED